MNAPQGQRVEPCRYCPNEVVLGGKGLWVHVNGRGFECRDAANVKLGTYAEPVGWPMNPGRSW
jgi:hypothetical protein